MIPGTIIWQRLWRVRPCTACGGYFANENTTQINLRWYLSYCLTVSCEETQYFTTLQSVLCVIRAHLLPFPVSATWRFRKAPRLNVPNFFQWALTVYVSSLSHLSAMRSTPFFYLGSLSIIRKMAYSLVLDSD